MHKFLAERIRASPLDRLSERRLLIGLFGSAVFLYWISLYLYVPTLPTFVESKSDSLALVGVVLAQYGLWQALVRLPLGVAADWLGWHKLLIGVGFGLAGLGAGIMALAGGVGQLALGRAVTGLSAGTWVPLVVVFSGLFAPEDAVRATAILTFVGSVGRVLATAATGWLNEIGGHELAFFLAAGAAGLAIVILIPARVERRSSQRPSFRVTGSLITRRDVLLPSLLAAVSQYANWAATFSFMPILARNLGATDVTQSMLLSLHVGVVVVGNLAATTIVHRLGPRRLVYVSFLLLSGALGLAAVAPSLPAIFVAQFWMGVSQGIGYPVLMGLSIQRVANANRATAMGLHQAVYAIGMFTAPWLSGVLADAIGIQPMFGATALGCLALSGVLAWGLVPKDVS